MVPRLERLGRQFYRLAWSIEILAVAVGLALALAQGLEAWSEAQGAISLAALSLASGGFLIVAMAELAKIPVATALVHSRSAWRPAIALLLLVMSVITFETVFFSLERGFTVRMFGVEQQRHILEALEAERAALLARRDGLEANAFESADQLHGRFETLRRSVIDQLANLDEELNRLDDEQRPPAARALLQEERQLVGERTRLIAERDSKIQEETRRFESQRDSFHQRMKDARDAGDDEGVRHWQRKLDGLQGPGRRIEQLHAEYTDALRRIDHEIDDRQKRRRNLEGGSRPGFEQRRSGLIARRDHLNAELALFSSQETAESRQLAEQRQSRQRDRAALDDEVARLDRVIGEERQKLALRAETTQIYRVAAFLYGKASEAVESHEAKFVAALWFGSIAFIAATAGAATAMLSQMMLCISLDLI